MAHFSYFMYAFTRFESSLKRAKQQHLIKSIKVKAMKVL